MRYPAIAKVIDLTTGIPYLASCKTTSGFDAIKEETASFYGLAAENLKVERILPVDPKHPMNENPRGE